MKKKWIFFALVPLFSYAVAEEEWLSETTFPREMEKSEPKNKEISLSRREPRAPSRSRRSESSIYKKKSYASSDTYDEEEREEGKRESRWAAFLERLTLQKEGKKGLNIVTNRKRNLSLSEEDEAVEEEEVQEKPSSKYHYRAREKISAETDRRDREMTIKRKAEVYKKNQRRVQKEMDED